MATLTPDRETRFRALYADAYQDVVRFAQRRGHPSHAEDLAADTFLVAWRRLDEAPKRRDDLRAWLFGIARHCLLNTQRGLGRRDALAVRVAEALPASGTLAGIDPDLIAERLDLAAAWRRLSETDQEALSLAVFEDLTSPQAARVLAPRWSASWRARRPRPTRRQVLRSHDNPHVGSS
ncbi:MAG: RNA polymerase sigma factor [Nocardioidaceae bacterium]